MNRADKILIILMVLLLPLGLFATYRLFPDPDEVALQQEEMEKRVEAAIAELSETAAEKRKRETQPIKLSSVSLATESATMKVMGGAPMPDAAMLVSATVLPKVNVADKSKDAELIKGSSVETFSVLTNNKGSFIFEFEVPEIEGGIVEMRLEQGDSVETLRFDLDKMVQLE